MSPRPKACLQQSLSSAGSETSETICFHPIVSDTVNHRSKQEITDLMEQVAELRFKGASFQEIAGKLGLSKATASRYYTKYLDTHQREWFVTRRRTLAELTEKYKRKLSESEKNYEFAKSSGNEVAMAGWHKVSLETLKGYVDFLKDVGFINEDSVRQLSEILVEPTQKSALELLIEEHQKYLKETIDGKEKK